MAVHSVLTAVASLVAECGLQVHGLRRSQRTGLKLWNAGRVAPQHVESWTRDQTHVPCIGTWILIHCATREVQTSISFTVAYL